MRREERYEKENRRGGKKRNREKEEKREEEGKCNGQEKDAGAIMKILTKKERITKRRK